VTETVASDLPLDASRLTTPASFRLAAAVRWSARAIVAFVIFAWYHGVQYLDIFAAPRFLRGDWTTYVVSSNYLRTSPVLTVPLAEVPGYIAPRGTDLAMTDSLPSISPLYRLLLEIWPDRPVQLVGWEVLVAVVLTFLTVARFLDAVADLQVRPLSRELLTLALATVVTIAPFWAVQDGHPALMQHWILVWAIAGALRRCPTVLGGHLRPIQPGWTGLGPICAAAAVHPYLIPMAALPALAPDMADVRRAPRRVVMKVVAAAGAAVVIPVVLGYLDSGARLGSVGFGFEAADLATVLNPYRYSNWFGALHFSAGAFGGFGYLGVGALVLVGAGAVLAVVRGRAHRSGGAPEAATADRRPARCLYVAIGLLTIFAISPQVRLLGHQVIDVTVLTRPFDSLTAVFRVNGRFVWPVLWLALLLASASTLRASRVVAACVIGAALILQLGDVTGPPSLLRPQSQVEYGAARHGLETQIAEGATSVQFEPPVVIPGCHDATTNGKDFERLGDVLLAAAVLRLPVNSGYTARFVPEFYAINCRAQAAAFKAGAYDPRVVYVLPASGTPVPGDLTCTPLTRERIACRWQRLTPGREAPARP